MTATRIFAIVSRNDLVGFLNFTELIQFFFCAEARISTSFLNQFLDDDFIDVGTFGLGIGSIGTFFLITKIAFIRNDSEVSKLIDKVKASAFDFTLLVGIL